MFIQSLNPFLLFPDDEFAPTKAWKEAGTPVACERSHEQLERIERQRNDLKAKMAQINAQRGALRSLLAALDDILPIDADDADAEEENPALVCLII